VIATQAIEAGVEHLRETVVHGAGPWALTCSAIRKMQPLRVSGATGQAEVHWIDVKVEPAPYLDEELIAAQGLLQGLDDVGIEALNTVKPPPRHAVCQVLRRRDVMDLVRHYARLGRQRSRCVGVHSGADDRDVSVLWREQAGERAPSMSRPIQMSYAPSGLRLVPAS